MLRCTTEVDLVLDSQTHVVSETILLHEIKSFAVISVFSCCASVDFMHGSCIYSAVLIFEEDSWLLFRT